MTRVSRSPGFRWGVLLCLVGVAPVSVAQSYFQIGGGALELDDTDITLESDGEDLPAELPDKIYYLGGAVQKPWTDGLFGAGWEGGGHANWMPDNIEAYARSGDGTRVRVSVDSSYFGMETFLGLYGSFQPFSRLRFYVGAGPSITMGFFDGNNDDEDEDETAEDDGSQNGGVVKTNNVTIVLSDVSFGYGLGYYGRAGVEVLVSQKISLGVAIRHQDTHMKFGGDLDSADFDGDMLMFTVGGRL